MTESDQISATTAFKELTPDQMLDAIESTGVCCDGRFLALNSYENRVYQVWLEGGDLRVAKFYRPARWSNAAILEEHRFTEALEQQEIPVIPPIRDADGNTLHQRGPFRFALYPCRSGRPPELDDGAHLEQLGRLIGRIHAMGAIRSYRHRPTVDIDTLAVDAQSFLLDNRFIPDHLTTAYQTLTDDLIAQIRICFERAGEVQHLRLHGDCHPGNILWTDEGPHIVDFDDARMGPAVQDLWMFLSGNREYMTARLADLLEGYTRFHDFNPAELHLVEALRTLRMIHYAAWIALRWSDPAFPQAFPWFNTTGYWEEHILALREQAALLDEPVLVWS